VLNTNTHHASCAYYEFVVCFRCSYFLQFGSNKYHGYSKDVFFIYKYHGHHSVLRWNKQQMITKREWKLQNIGTHRKLKGWMVVRRRLRRTFKAEVRQHLGLEWDEVSLVRNKNRRQLLPENGHWWHPISNSSLWTTSKVLSIVVHIILAHSIIEPSLSTAVLN
jgi:hypothetical protein